VRAERIDILEVHLPFRMVFGHSLAKRKSSTNLWVRVQLADGTAGHGEAVPRSYVTGETVLGAAQQIGERLEGSWWRRGLARWRRWRKY
jgi:L-alanine-DL-glutamate epimerase-like enolase superfamily enzyme